MKKIAFNKKMLIFVLFLILIVLIGNVIFYQNRQIKKLKEKISSENQSSSNIGTETSQSPTKEAVPENIKVPEKGEKISEDVAVPTEVAQAAPGVEAKYRSFDIKGENNKFIPSTIIVKLGDTVHINFTAQDKDYDITFPDYNMKQVALKGQTKVLEFQAVLEGKFTYYCEMCGGLNSTAKGYIIVVK